MALNPRERDRTYARSSRKCGGILIVVEDHPNALRDWYFTLVFSYAFALDLQVLLVKHTGADFRGVVPTWICEFLGRDSIIFSDLGSSSWCKEVAERIDAR